jgi:sulfite exporter TauE/SafE
VHAALALAVAAGAPLAGAGVMVAFGVGTSPGPSAAAFGLRRVLDRAGRWGRYGLAAAVLVTGLGAVATRWPTASGEPSCHAEAGSGAEAP